MVRVPIMWPKMPVTLLGRSIRMPEMPRSSLPNGQGRQPQAPGSSSEQSAQQVRWAHSSLGALGACITGRSPDWTSNSGRLNARCCGRLLPGSPDQVPEPCLSPLSGPDMAALRFTGSPPCETPDGPCRGDIGLCRGTDGPIRVPILPVGLWFPAAGTTDHSAPPRQYALRY